MKTKSQKLFLALTIALSISVLQAEGEYLSQPHTALVEVFLDKSDAMRLIRFCVNGIGTLIKNNYVSAKAFFSAAGIIGIGKTLLWKLDTRALKKDPQHEQAYYRSWGLNSLVVAAGLTPILFSDSQAGKHARAILSPVYERQPGR